MCYNCIITHTFFFSFFYENTKAFLQIQLSFYVLGSVFQNTDTTKSHIITEKTKEFFFSSDVRF